MRTWPDFIKTLLTVLLVSCVCTSGAYAAVVKPQLDIQGGAGTVVSDGTTLTMDGLAIAIIMDSPPNIDIPDTIFSLDVTTATGLGSLAVGTLLTADVSSFSLTNLGFGYGTFSAELLYTGGSLAGVLTGGSIEGAFENAVPFGFDLTSAFTANSLTGKIGPVAVVPVPAAVWLFGSGLLGLISVARKRTRQ